MEKNLRRLDALLGELPGSLACFHTTVQAYNVMALPELIRYATGQFQRFLPFPILSPLFWPDALSVQVLPVELKERASDRLQSLNRDSLSEWRGLEGRCDYPNGAERFVASIEGILRLLHESDRSELLPEFWRLTDYFDHSRQQDLRSLETAFHALRPSPALSRG